MNLSLSSGSSSIVGVLLLCDQLVEDPDSGESIAEALSSSVLVITGRLGGFSFIINDSLSSVKVSESIFGRLSLLLLVAIPLLFTFEEVIVCSTNLVPLICSFTYCRLEAVTILVLQSQQGIL